MHILSNIRRQCIYVCINEHIHIQKQTQIHRTSYDMQEPHSFTYITEPCSSCGWCTCTWAGLWIGLALKDCTYINHTNCMHLGRVCELGLHSKILPNLLIKVHTLKKWAHGWQINGHQLKREFSVTKKTNNNLYPSTFTYSQGNGYQLQRNYKFLCILVRSRQIKGYQ
jgi:hypothetical protein